MNLTIDIKQCIFRAHQIEDLYTSACLLFFFELLIQVPLLETAV